MVFLNCVRFAKKSLTKNKLIVGPFKPASRMSMDECLGHSVVPYARPFHPCSIFFDRTLSKFISKGNRCGQRTLMRELMRETFQLIKQSQLTKLNQCTDETKQTNIICDPLVIFHGALENCKPLLVTRVVKRGGATYQVPFPISEQESEDFAMRWLLETVNERPKPKKTYFPEVMAKELIDCYYNEGKVIKRKQDMHRQCEGNKAYAHYRWG